jgi:hypothetical protein
VKSDAPLYESGKKCISAFISHAKRANINHAVSCFVQIGGKKKVVG